VGQSEYKATTPLGQALEGQSKLDTSTQGSVSDQEAPEDLGRSRKIAKAVGRVALETGAGITAAYLTGGATAPLTAGRIVSGVNRLRQVVQATRATRPVAAAAGEAAGSLASESFDPSGSVGGAARSARNAALFGGAGEKVGITAAEKLSRLSRGGTDLVPGGREAVEDLEGVISVGATTKNRPLDVVEGMTRASLVGGGRVTKFLERSEALAQRKVDEVVARFRTTPMDELKAKQIVEKQVHDSLRGRADGFRAAGGELYDEITQFDDLRIDFGDVLDDALAKKKKGLGTSELEDLVRRFERKFPKDPETGEIVDTTLSWKEAHNVRSDFAGAGRTPTESIKGKSKGVASDLAKQMDELMMDASQRLSPEGVGAWRKADEFWKAGHKIFDDPMMKSLTKEFPQSVFDTAVKNESAGNIIKLRNAIFNPKFMQDTQQVPAKELWQNIQGEWLMDLMRRSTSAVEGGDRFGSVMLTEIGKMGEPAFRALFPDAKQAAAIKRAARTLEISQAGVGKGIPGTIAIQLMQPGAAINIVAGGGGGKGRALSFAIIGGPPVMARVLGNPNFNKWATIGRHAEPFSEAWFGAWGQIMSIATAEGAEVASRPGTQPEQGPYQAKTDLGRRALGQAGP